MMATPNTSKDSQHNVMQHLSPLPIYEKSSIPQTIAYPAPETRTNSSNTAIPVAAKNNDFGCQFHHFPP